MYAICIQTILGGFKDLHEAKTEQRRSAGLSILEEDPLKIVREMKASVPPTSASDILEIAQAPKRRRGKVRIMRHFRISKPIFSHFLHLMIESFDC